MHYYGRVQLETLKLLVEVAWADRVIDRHESEYLFELARQLDANEGEHDEQIEELTRSLDDAGRLPAPNLRLLRDHREAVLRAVDELLCKDDRIAADERAARAAIDRLLARA